jgi:hypothetical protein
MMTLLSQVSLASSAMAPLKPLHAEPPVCGEFILDLSWLSFVHAGMTMIRCKRPRRLTAAGPFAAAGSVPAAIHIATQVGLVATELAAVAVDIGQIPARRAIPPSP